MVDDQMDRSVLVTKLLAGSWRAEPALAAITAGELREVAPFLLRTGGGGLARRAVRNLAARRWVYGDDLRQAQRIQTIQAAVYEERLERVYDLLRSEGFEPLLIKGWAVARLYPEAGLRPYGDLDLAVHPEEFSAVEKILAERRALGNSVDLHKGLRRLDRVSFEEVYARSEVVRVREIDVRVPCNEDHLRILATHMLGHGVWRPLWLCDVALMVESAGPDFNWSVCFGKGGRRAGWVMCAVGLAHQLLGVEIDTLPFSDCLQRLPSWLSLAVRRQWNLPLDRHVSQQRPFSSFIGEGRGVLRALFTRWPNPVEATISVDGRFNSWPRFPYQLLSSGLRSLRFLGSVLQRS